MANVTLHIPPLAAPRRLSDYLAEQGIALSAPCGGRGTCGKCRVRLLSGTLYDRTDGRTPLVPDGEGYVLACRALVAETAVAVEIPDTEGEGLTAFLATAEGKGGREGYGVALDVGTTTLAAALVDLSSGQTLGTVSRLNPQRSYGADVITRIGAASAGKLLELRDVLLSTVREMLAELSVGLAAPVSILTVAGNTTMLHLFLGVSPEGMGAYPFTPAFTESKTLPGADLSLPVDTVVLLPSVSAFIGADVVAGAVALGMTDSAAPALLVDVGTNGEMLLSVPTSEGVRLFAASAAAGPAFEGAGISSGVGGIPGAVCRVWEIGNRLLYRTVSDAPSVGICGAGLLDLVALMLKRGDLDETGYLEDDPYSLFGVWVDGEGDPLPPAPSREVTLTGKDIRELQLAKSAIRAGLEALLSHAGIKPADLAHVYLAGGFGYYMDPASASAIGLLPEEALPAVGAVGNSALAGAILALTDPDALSRMERAGKECEGMDLNASAVFHAAFMEHMMFPEPY